MLSDCWAVEARAVVVLEEDEEEDRSPSVGVGAWGVVVGLEEAMVAGDCAGLMEGWGNRSCVRARWE